MRVCCRVCVSAGACVCVSVCVSVCLPWAGSCRAAAGPSGSPHPAEGWGLSDQQRRLLPAAAPGLDGFAAGAPSDCGAAQEPREVTRGFAEERSARSPRLAPCPAIGIYIHAPPPAPPTLGLPAPHLPPRQRRLPKRSVLVKPGPLEEMEVFSLILVVSVCWTRTWKAAIADSIIHIGKGVLCLLVLLDTFPVLLRNLPSLGRLSPSSPRSPHSL